MVNTNRMVKEFLELVQVDSVSGKERQVADLLIKKLSGLGMEVFEDQAGQCIGANTGNIIGRLPGSGNGDVIMLCAHMDTVEPGRGIKPVVENNIIRSSGDTILGADDKAGIAAILETVRQIKEGNYSHSGLEIVFTIWEEGGLYGAKNLDYSLVSARTCFVLDSDGDPGTIVVRAPTQNRIGATIRGRAAHAGINPEEGINAIQVASHAISRMKLGRIDEETTCNIGIISGGQAINIVPDSVNLQGEARSLDVDKLSAQTEHICRAIKDAAIEFGATADIVVEDIYAGFYLNQDSKPVNIAIQAAKNIGIEPVIVKTGGGSDANVFNYRGIATTVLGIGMKKVHTTEEYISVSNLERSASYLLEIIKVANKSS